MIANIRVMSLNDLFANASLFTPTEPESREKMGIDEQVIEGLILRMLYLRTTVVAYEMVQELCVPFYGVLEPILTKLRDSRLIEIVRGDISANYYVYGMTEAGRTRAQQSMEQTTYIGPAPVSVDDYVKNVAQQSLRNVTVNADRLRQSFRGMVYDDLILESLGPAVNSGRSIFLYGPPGNGKTSICERMVESFGGAIFIPYAIEVKGSIIKVFDEYNHSQVFPESDMRLQGKYDRRYRLIKRPVIIVGGELTMESLDLIWNKEARFYEAPFQLKANGGAFMIDDFGRQRIEPKTLLNRWIVPLEKRRDFLTLHTGTKIEIPFDELIIFSTNLNPKDLVDEAFLRRIRYKIAINDPTYENFRTIWRIVSEKNGLPYMDEIVDYFVQNHLVSHKRPFRGCIPRDIIDNIIDMCRYRQIEPTITAQMLDDAANAYFARFEDKNYSAVI